MFKSTVKPKVIHDNRASAEGCGCKTFAVSHHLRFDEYHQVAPVNPNWLRLNYRKHAYLGYFYYYWGCWYGCGREVITFNKQYSFWDGLKIERGIRKGTLKPDQEYYKL